LKKIDLIILAGGKGSRISRFTKKIPKPLIKIKNQTLLNILIRNYAKYDFENIFILCGYKSNIIKKEFHNTKINLTKVTCINESKPMGTAGALFGIKKKCKNDFILANGDSYIDFNLIKFCNNNSNKIIKMSVVKNTNYKSNKKLNNLVISSGMVKYGKSNNINAGVYFIKNKFLKQIKNKNYSLESDIIPALINKKKVSGQKVNSFFLDIGTYQNLNFGKKIIPKETLKKAAFLDRDGVINFDYKYVHSMKNFKLKKNVIAGLKFLQKKGYLLFIVTNQAGIAKGFYTVNNFEIFQKKIYKIFKKNNIFISDTQFCPHHPNAKIKKYRKICGCRKPGNLMIKNILSNYNIDIKNSFMIGDKKSDFECAKKSNLKFIYATKDFKEVLKRINM
jgi:D,D-heptose 1,7-bisphosphate phosphatase